MKAGKAELKKDLKIDRPEAQQHCHPTRHRPRRLLTLLNAISLSTMLALLPSGSNLHRLAGGFDVLDEFESDIARSS